jgi:DNA primase
MMTLHIQKFVDRVRGFELKGSKDFVMSINDAKDLHADLTRLLLELHDLRENLSKPQQADVITVKMDGGSF